MLSRWQLLIYRQLVVLMALLAVCGVVVSAFHCPFFFLVVSVLAGIILGGLVRSWRLIVILGVIPIVFWFYVGFRESKPAPDDLGNWQYGRLILIKGLVDELPRLDARGHSEMIVKAQEVLSPQKQKVSGKCLVRTNGKIDKVTLNVNDAIELKIFLDKPQSNPHAWDFDSRAYLRKRGVSQSAWLAKQEDLRLLKSGESNWFAGQQKSVVAARKYLVETHCKYLGETEGALLTSMVIGDRAVNLPDALVKQFRDVGLSHVLAASGFNLTIVCGSTLFLVRLLLKTNWLGNVACLASMLAFVVIAGPTPSVLRSAFMLCFMLLYRTAARKAPISMALAMATIAALLLDPLCITDIGFQLSYVATAAIVVGVEPFKKIFSRLKKHPGIAEAVSVIVIAQMGVLPIQLYYFWCLGLFFLPANLLVAPFVHLVTLSGFASSLLILASQQFNWLEHLIWLIDKITWFPLTAILVCVQYMASFEQAKLILGSPHIVSLVFYYFAFSLFLASLKCERWRIVCTTVLVISICTLAWRPTPASVAIAYFKNSVAIVDLDRKALVLGDAEATAVKKFLFYHGAMICPEIALKILHSENRDEVFIPSTKTLIGEVKDTVLAGQLLTSTAKFETLILSVKGSVSPSRIVDALLSNEQFGGYLAEGKSIWLVFDRGLSKVGRASIVSRLPSCVKIATRSSSKSLVFEASNESIKIRD